MQQQSRKKKFSIELVFPNNLTRHVQVKATDREAAERRALKFNPSALRVKREGEAT